jgi:outer membrane protein
MKKTLTVLSAVMGLILAATSTRAQTTKIATISLGELISKMPEYKKADTAMTEFQSALQQQYQEMANEYQSRSAELSGKDTVKYNAAQLEVKRRQLNDLLTKLQGWNQTAQQMSQQKNDELMAPIKKKALDAVNAVAKENGYSWVISKDEKLLVSPPSDDILPLVKKKLGLK